MREFRTWAPDLDAVLYSGNEPSRTFVQKNMFERLSNGRLAPKFHVLVIPWHIATSDASFLKRTEWDVLVCKIIIINKLISLQVVDEAHRLKNDASSFNRFLSTFDSEFRLLLTGTGSIAASSGLTLTGAATKVAGFDISGATQNDSIVSLAGNSYANVALGAEGFDQQVFGFDGGRGRHGDSGSRRRAGLRWLKAD